MYFKHIPETVQKLNYSANYEALKIAIKKTTSLDIPICNRKHL